MEEAFRECGIRVSFMNEKTKRAFIIIGFIVKNGFGDLLYLEIPNIPKSTQNKANKLGEYVKPEVWKDSVFHENTLRILNSLKSVQNPHLSEFVNLFPEEFPLAHRFIIYMITYSQRNADEIRKISGLKPPRLVIKKIQTFFMKSNEYDPAAIRFLYRELAKNN